ncbi:hypothetical protein RND81_03G030000 [Saponaria officinalis]|uniref:E2F/DP family winged-helix DNA-binding domain-containing protein n=1 Tax=Saponaria officinalis TaxID=3572 RepID=A0AAW1M420_SAPOF
MDFALIHKIAVHPASTLSLFFQRSIFCMATSAITAHVFFPSVNVNGMNSDTSQLKFSHANNVLDDSSLPETQSHVTRKRGRKPKKAKQANPDPSTSDADYPMTPVICRYESSLGLLTKKFVDLVRQSENGMVDLNTIATKLEVRKRRLGFDSETDELANQASKLQIELECLSSQEALIDESIREKQQLLETLCEDEINKKHLFLSAADIMTLPDFKGKTVFAIKAPRGSYFEVPDPEKDLCSSGKQCRIIVRSAIKPIDVHVLSKCDRNSTNFASVSGSYCGAAENERAASSNQFQDLHRLDRCIAAERDSFEIHNITPSDFYRHRPEEDYWLKSDIKVSLTNLWSS